MEWGQVFVIIAAVGGFNWYFISRIHKDIDRIDAHMAQSNARIDATGARIDAMGARIDQTQNVLLRMLEKQGR